MRRLFPVTDQTAAPSTADLRDWSLDELADAYAYPPGAAAGEATWLRANMVSTLDGAAQHDGRSQPISNDTDMRIFGTCAHSPTSWTWGPRRCVPRATARLAA